MFSKSLRSSRVFVDIPLMILAFNLLIQTSIESIWINSTTLWLDHCLSLNATAYPWNRSWYSSRWLANGSQRLGYLLWKNRMRCIAQQLNWCCQTFNQFVIAVKYSYRNLPSVWLDSSNWKLSDLSNTVECMQSLYILSVSIHWLVNKRLEKFVMLKSKVINNFRHEVHKELHSASSMKRCCFVSSVLLRFK